jgi:hypothetical protein
MINAHQFPGPALWQGIMLCLLPLLITGMFYKNGRLFRYFCIGYACVGALLMCVIVHFFFFWV